MMCIQWYRGDQYAGIFCNNNMCVKLYDCKSRRDVDQMLHRLGSRRRTKWHLTDWGYEALIRRI